MPRVNIKSNGKAIFSLKDRIQTWLSHNKSEAFLDNVSSKDDLQRKLTGWVDRRRQTLDKSGHNHNLIITYIDYFSDRARHPMNGDCLGDAEKRHLHEFAAAIKARNNQGHRLEDEWVLQAVKAAFLCSSLRVKHGVHWTQVSGKKLSYDHVVVGTLMALGQTGIDLNTLHNLQRYEERQRMMTERRQLVAENIGFLHLFHEHFLQNRLLQNRLLAGTL